MTSRVTNHFLMDEEDRQCVDFAVRRQCNKPSDSGKGFVGVNPMVDEEGWGRRLPRCKPPFGLRARCFPLVEKPKTVAGSMSMAVANESNVR